MSTEELSVKFCQWNPMESDYKNTEFNHYISGPGADVNAELLLPQQVLPKSGSDSVDKLCVPSLIFKNVPINMTKKALHNICSRHGSVMKIRSDRNNIYYFVDMATVADMEAALRALEKNCYGFQVEIAKKQKHVPSSNIERTQSGHTCLEERNCALVHQSIAKIDYEHRSFRTSQKNHPRPKVVEDSFLNKSDVVVSDAHSLERCGLFKMENNNQFKYRHGRAYISMSEKSKQFIEKKHEDSSGVYNEEEDKYTHYAERCDIQKMIGLCSKCFKTCDTVCERCSLYYCSLDCQKSDWADHRYKCGKPKHVQETQSKKKLQFEKSPNEKLEGALVSGPLEVAKGNNKSKTFPDELLKCSEVVPKNILGLNNAVSEQSITSPNTLQRSNYLKEFQKPSVFQSNSPQQMFSKLSLKKLPIALRTSSRQVSNFSEECVKQLSTPSIVSSHKVSRTSKVTQCNINRNAFTRLQIYKQNMPRSGNIVTITSISKVNVLFIRSTTYEDNLSYFRTVDSLQLIGKTLAPLKSLPKSGEVVIAKFEEQFNRALVLESYNTSKIVIHFMDYGNTEQATIQDLLEAPKEFVYEPRHAIPVILKDVSNYCMTQEIRTFMHSYLNNINVEIRYKPEDFQQDNQIFAVELIDESTHLNLNKTIMKLSKPVEPQNIEEVCGRDYLKKEMLPVGKNVELIVMDNSLMCSGCISCTTKPYAIEIEKFKNDIQAYVESIPNEPYTPRVQDLCIARYVEDGLWYRGLCLETVGDGHPSILFIDYGNITIIPIEGIRPYPRQFSYPIYTSDCAIEGLPEFCDDKLVEKLEQLIPNGVLINCENITVDEDCNFYTLSISSIIKELNLH